MTFSEKWDIRGTFPRKRESKITSVHKLFNNIEEILKKKKKLKESFGQTERFKDYSDIN